MKKIQTESVTEDVEIITGLTCDVCGHEYFLDCPTGHPDNDICELQEFQSLDFTGGYASVFGDSVRVTIDICQHCLKQMIGKYARFDEGEEHEWCYNDMGPEERQGFLRRDDV